jgi:hypothetical protein
MTQNKNGAVAAPHGQPHTLSEIMDCFDSLPREFRDIVNYASFQISSNSLARAGLAGLPEPKRIIENIEYLTRLNALACYGPDHPQAKEVQ